MSVNLQKGQKVSLSKDNPGLSRIVVGLGWDEVQRRGGLFAPRPQDIDCDASAILLQDGKLRNKYDLVFYNNLSHPSGSVQHMGDNLTGAGAGDDEQIVVDLSRVPPQIDRIVFTVTIYDAYRRKQHFGMIRNAFIRLVNTANGQEICRYNLTENYDNMTAMIFGEVYRHNGEWKFNAIGSATSDGSIVDVANRYS